METDIRTYPAQILMEPLLALIGEGQTVPLVISGNSMSPFLVHGRDTVYLAKIPDRLKRGDMVLFKRPDGNYVLHRIVRVDGNRFTMNGDSQTWLEEGISRSQILAIVTAVHRKGKLLHKGSFWWLFFRHVWSCLIPYRPKMIQIYSRLGRKKRSQR